MTNIINNNITSLKNRLPGAAALVTVLGLGSLIGMAGIFIAGLAVLENNIAHAQKRNLEAYYGAISAIEDNVIKLQRNRAFSCSNCSITIGAATVTVNVSNLGSSANITASSVVLGTRRNFQLDVTIADNGLITIGRLREITN